MAETIPSSPDADQSTATPSPKEKWTDLFPALVGISTQAQRAIEGGMSKDDLITIKRNLRSVRTIAD